MKLIIACCLLDFLDILFVHKHRTTKSGKIYIATDIRKFNTLIYTHFKFLYRLKKQIESFI